MPAGPPLTVAIAAHDDERFVAAAVRSVLRQVPAPAEVVVCDDASTDGTPDVLRAFGDSIRVLRHPTNSGEAATKNTAVEAATTEHVVLLDGDDEFLPGRLRAMGELWAAKPELDIVTTDAFLVQGEEVLGRWYHPGNPLPLDDQRLDLLSRNPVFGHPGVRRSRFLQVGGFDAALRHATDWDCWLRMVLSGSRIGVVPEALARYRLHVGNASADRVAMLSANVSILERALRRNDLTTAERRAAEAALAERGRRREREQLKQALSAGSAEVRPLAHHLVLDPRQPGRSRLLAGLCWLTPLAAGAARRRAEHRRWTGPGGLRLRRT